jgi:hypothetical protein
MESKEAEEVQPVDPAPIEEVVVENTESEAPVPLENAIVADDSAPVVGSIDEPTKEEEMVVEPSPIVEETRPVEIETTQSISDSTAADSVSTHVAPVVVEKKTQVWDALNAAVYRSPQSVADLGRECSALHHVFGVDGTKKGNFSLIEDDTIVYTTASSVIFQNVTTSAKEYLMSIGDDGVGCVAVHPNRSFGFVSHCLILLLFSVLFRNLNSIFHRKMFAVGGMGYQPKIYIYSYPTKKVIHTI